MRAGVTFEKVKILLVEELSDQFFFTLFMPIPSLFVLPWSVLCFQCESCLSRLLPTFIANYLFFFQFQKKETLKRSEL